MTVFHLTFMPDNVHEYQVKFTVSRPADAPELLTRQTQRTPEGCLKLFLPLSMPFRYTRRISSFSCYLRSLSGMADSTFNSHVMIR